MNKIALAGAVASALAFTTSAQAVENDLMSAVRTSAPITIDGHAEALWDQAEALTVTVNELPYEPNNGYAGMTEVEVELKALYDDEHIYLQARWQDPSKSLVRFPWVKQEDGSWKQLMNKDSTQHENTYYEDKFSIFWDINNKGFAKKGCDRSCHMVEEGTIKGIPDTSAGRHYTARDGETIDMWHWKSARTNPVGQVDDQYVNHNRNEAKEWGRHSDDKTAGAYVNNINAEGTAPAWMNKTASEENTYWVLDSDKVPFEDHFKPGDVIGGIVAKPAEGNRGDLPAKAVWHDGVWTLEIKRTLTTQHENSASQDVQFDDLSKTYLFGVAVFDNTQINHLYHKKSLKMRFQQ